MHSAYNVKNRMIAANVASAGNVNAIEKENA